MKRCIFVMLLCAAGILCRPLAITTAFAVELPVAAKPVVLFVEGDSSVIPKFVNMCRDMGPERGLDFRFVDKREDKYDYRVILSAEGTGMWNYAQGNIVVMNPEGKLLFTVTRSNRLTAKGATSALSKEFISRACPLLGHARLTPLRRVAQN
jgi:hypothetical protein